MARKLSKYTLRNKISGDRLQQHVALRNESSTQINSLAKWREDDLLKTMMTDMKSQCQIIAHSCVKLALLYSASSVKREAADSLFQEIHTQLQTFLNIYL